MWYAWIDINTYQAIYIHTHIHIYIHIYITHIYTGANTKSGWCNVVPRFRDIKIALTG